MNIFKRRKVAREIAFEQNNSSVSIHPVWAVYTGDGRFKKQPVKVEKLLSIWFGRHKIGFIQVEWNHEDWMSGKVKGWQVDENPSGVSVVKKLDSVNRDLLKTDGFYCNLPDVFKTEAEALQFVYSSNEKLRKDFLNAEKAATEV
jgi:hypothetical protein